MTLHATSFALYMFSFVLYLIVYLMYDYRRTISSRAYLICYGITLLCSALSQLVLCVIFWDLGKKRVRRPQKQPHP